MPLADILKVFIPAALTFFVGIFLTPLLTHYLYKHKMWKKKAGKKGIGGGGTPLFTLLHKEKEVGTPKMGGVIIWGSVLITVAVLWFIAYLYPTDLTEKLNFLGRNQTWLPLFALISGSLIGLIDDFLEVSEPKRIRVPFFSHLRGDTEVSIGGLSLKKRLLVVSLVGLVGAWWFYVKLGISSVSIPFDGILDLGIFFVPFFIMVMLAVYAGGIIDGIDGLAGGVFGSAFFAYSVIALYQDQVNLAAFCAVVASALLAFLWYNIPPARFYMSETGTMGLTLSLTIVAFLTDAHVEGKGVLVLPIIAFPLVMTVFSDIVQVFSKKVFHKKVLKIAPLHHHFEALGWPSYKVTMRYWVISIVFAIIGVIIALAG